MTSVPVVARRPPVSIDSDISFIKLLLNATFVLYMYICIYIYEMICVYTHTHTIKKQVPISWFHMGTYSNKGQSKSALGKKK